jgi:hypothetical protein
MKVSTLKLFLITSLLAFGAEGAGKPNIILMMVDNPGWGELGVYGAANYTERLVMFADELYRFSASYSWTGVRGLDYSLGGSLTVFGDSKIDNTVQGVRVKGDFDSNYLLFLGGTLRYVF